VFGPRGCMTVGEGANVDDTNVLDYILPEREELNMVYHFQLSHRALLSMTPAHFRNVQTKWANVFSKGGWTVQYMSNHDSARQVSCYGDAENYREASAMLLATLLHTTPGTPFVYQGEEIGMVNVTYDSIDDYNCCYTKGDYHSMMQKGISPKEALKTLAPKSRDNARTPYQWDDTANAGFTSGKPWLKTNPTYKEINLQADLKAENSIFNYYKEVIALRKTHPAIIEGELQFLLAEHPHAIVYLRKCEAETLLVIANYRSEATTVELPDEIKTQKWQRILSNYKHTQPSLDGRKEWMPWEAEVYVLA